MSSSIRFAALIGLALVSGLCYSPVAIFIAKTIAHLARAIEVLS